MTLHLDVVIEDPRWADAGLEGLAKCAAGVVANRCALPDQAEAVVLACSDARIAELNTQFRGLAKSTNVLSWPSEERGPVNPGQEPRAANEPELGDIAVAFETCHAEAQAQNIPFPDHVVHLLVHGILHLLGYDHENDADAARMEGLETELLEILGISDPYDLSAQA